MDEIVNNHEKLAADDIISRMENDHDIEKEVVSLFLPDTAGSDARAAVKQAVLGGGEIPTWPEQNYPNLAAANFDDILAKLANYKNQLSETDLAPKLVPIYEAQVDEYIKINQLMQAAQKYKIATNNDEKSAARESYMRLNGELFGEPDRDDFNEILGSWLREIKAKNLTGEAAVARDKVLAGLGEIADEAGDTQPYRPKPETMAWLQHAANVIDAPFDKHLPKNNRALSTEEAAAYFVRVRGEFRDQESGRDAAEGWTEVVKPEATGFDMNPQHREERIPGSRPEPIDREVLRNIANSHEIGVHILRSLMGEQLNVAPARTGFAGYYATEEGFGKVMEEARKGEIGSDNLSELYHLIVGLNYFHDKKPEKAFDLCAQLMILKDLPDGASDIPAELKGKDYDIVLSRTQRIFRGTDDLPLFKDLSYYTGGKKVWQYFDSIVDSPQRDELLVMAFAGKYDFTGEEQRRLQALAEQNPQYGTPEPEIDEAGMTEAERLQLRQVAGKFIVDREMLEKRS